MKLDLFTNVKGTNQLKQHPKFLELKNNSQLWYEKNILLDWSDGFVDRDKKFIREFQETFHSSFWELFLYRLFSDAKFVLDQTHPMPDFIIKLPQEVYVEAVVANIRSNGVPENARTLEDQLSMTQPPYLQNDFFPFLNEAIIRASNAIRGKHTKYIEEYVHRSWIDSSKPYVIAMASFDQINYGREYIYSMLALLYGFYYIPKDDSFIKKETILKFANSCEKGKEVPIGLFMDTQFSDISAVIFTCTLTLGKLTSLSISTGNPSLNEIYNIRKNCDTGKYLLQYVDTNCPENIADGVFVFHNPNAKIKLSEEFFGGIPVTQVFFEDNKLFLPTHIFPLVARLNSSKLFHLYVDPMVKEHLRLYNKMDIESFYDIKEI